ncbi:MAG TPA: hypothetical protein VLJ37_02140 [bacterium]|nr:hypothetical protein [bacterium]
MRKTIIRLVPVILAAVTFASATAGAEGGLRADLFKTRWNRESIRPSPVLQRSDDCDSRAADKLDACIEQKVDDYQENPETLGECTKELNRCAYENCIPDVVTFHVECSLAEVRSNIMRSGRW